MSKTTDRMKTFVSYWESLEGDEKGEAQVYCDRLFKAFGHAGYKEAGATLEHRVKGKGTAGSTTYADLVWKPRVLMEMKKRGEKLQLHFRQAFDYWVHLVPDRPRARNVLPARWGTPSARRERRRASRWWDPAGGQDAQGRARQHEPAADAGCHVSGGGAGQSSANT